MNIGGPAIHAILLNEGLNRREFVSRLISGSCGKDEGDMAYLARDRGIEPIVITQLGREIGLGKDLIAFMKLFRLIRKEKPDIVHTHMAKAGGLGRLAAVLAGVPVKVHTFHGHTFHSYFNPVATKTFIFMEKFFGRFTDQAIVVSQTLKDEICSRFKVMEESKTSIISLGLDLDKFKSAGNARGILRKDLNISDKTLLVGIVGRLTPVKNHRLFLEAIKLFKGERRAYELKFLIIGDGELREYLQNYAGTLGIEEWVSFIGWRKDMPAVYGDLDVVVLTSFNEGTPLSLIEAMASQKAVIATAVGGVPDLVRDKEIGFLVPSNDPAKLKDAIAVLLCDESLRRRMGEAGEKYVHEKYSKSRLISDMENLYRGLLKRKGISI